MNDSAYQLHICRGAGTPRGRFVSYRGAFRTGKSRCDGEIDQLKSTCRVGIDGANVMLRNQQHSPLRIESAPISKTVNDKSSVIIGDCGKLELSDANVFCILLCCCHQCQIYHTVCPTQHAKCSLFPFHRTVGQHPRGEQNLRYRYQNNCGD